jgi:hypothetical protein
VGSISLYRASKSPTSTLEGEQLEPAVRGRQGKVSQVRDQERGYLLASLVVAIVAAVIAILTWLHPFEPVGKSPLERLQDSSGSGQTTNGGQTTTVVSPLDAKTPPLQDPGQDPLPAGAQPIGQPALERYCNQKYGLHVALRYLNTTWGWMCAADTTQGIGRQPGDRDVIVLEACHWQISAGSVSHYTDYHDPNSWWCYG